MPAPVPESGRDAPHGPGRRAMSDDWDEVWSEHDRRAAPEAAGSLPPDPPAPRRGVLLSLIAAAGLGAAAAGWAVQGRAGAVPPFPGAGTPPPPDPWDAAPDTTALSPGARRWLSEMEREMGGTAPP